ncbi:hypothetical protein BaRGS_00013353, partial [Batillaria attramentaria]
MSTNTSVTFNDTWPDSQLGSTPFSTATNGFDVNGSGLLSASTLEKFEVVVNAGILPALVVFGVTMNVINMAVFARQGLRDRINLCLFSLAISDSGFLLAHLASRIYILFYLFSSSLGDVFK